MGFKLHLSVYLLTKSSCWVCNRVHLSVCVNEFDIFEKKLPKKGSFPKNSDPSKMAMTRTPAIKVQTLPLEGPRILRVKGLGIIFGDRKTFAKNKNFRQLHQRHNFGSLRIRPQKTTESNARWPRPCQNDMIASCRILESKGAVAPPFLVKTSNCI